MPNAKRPAGPGRPTQERRDAIVEQEEMNELASDTNPAAAEDDSAERSTQHGQRGEQNSGDAGNGLGRLT